MTVTTDDNRSVYLNILYRLVLFETSKAQLVTLQLFFHHKASFVQYMRTHTA